MDYQQATEILQVFNSEILKQNLVKKVTEFCIPDLPSDGFKPRYRHADFFINDTGRVYEYKVYSGINIRTWLKFQYDNENELSEIKQLKSDKRSDDKWIVLKNNEIPDQVFVEELGGRRIDSTFFLNGKIKTQKIIDASGRIVSHNEFKNNTVIRSVIYSELNKIISDYRFDTDGKPTTKREYEYDSNNNLIRYKYTAKSGKVTTDLEMFYDKNNNLIESVDIPKEIYSVLFNVDLYKLAEQGNETESYRHKYTYNSFNLLIEHKIFLVGQYGTGYEYEYLMRS